MSSVGYAAHGPRPEKSELRLGFIPLTDCAPLVVAAEMGYFAEAGLAVELVRESSWANIRDQVQLGHLDGAHMLAPMPLASTLGVAGPACPMVTAFTMSLNGNAITVSRALHERMRTIDPAAMTHRPVSAVALKRVIEAQRAQGAPRLTFASVYPVSNHHYQLRYWLAAAGIDPDRDVRLIVVPPQLVAAQLASGRIDGFCVGEPWNTVAIDQGVGSGLISSYEIWNNGPEKVFAVTERWAERHPAAHRAMLRALHRACRWLDEPANRPVAATWLADRRYVGVPVAALTPGLSGRFQDVAGNEPRSIDDFMVFSRYSANFPWRSQGLWLGLQMVRWGQLADTRPLGAAVRRTYRTDIYREVAASLRVPAPEEDWKAEGLHQGDWLLAAGERYIPMDADCFCDGRVYDPAAPEQYLDGLSATLPSGGAASSDW